ncbi:hypothetical protein D3C85_1305370 [compost metagenome]
MVTRSSGQLDPDNLIEIRDLDFQATFLDHGAARKVMRLRNMDIDLDEHSAVIEVRNRNGQDNAGLAELLFQQRYHFLHAIGLLFHVVDD